MGYVAYVQEGRGAGPAADHVRVQRRAGLLVGLAAHGRARPAPRRDADAAPTPPPPYQVVDNAYSILDKSDLVMIDPVGTGLAEGASARRRTRTSGARIPDIDSISRFIRQYVTRQRPLELAEVPARRELRHDARRGHRERAPEQGHGLQRRHPRLGRHGPVGALRLSGQRPAVSAYPAEIRGGVRVPQGAADAAREPRRVPREVRAVRGGGVRRARCSRATRLRPRGGRAVVQKLHEYTGCPTTTSTRRTCASPRAQYTQEVLRQKGVTVGRLDARFLGSTLDMLSKEADYDPQSRGDQRPPTRPRFSPTTTTI